MMTITLYAPIVEGKGKERDHSSKHVKRILRQVTKDTSDAVMMQNTTVETWTSDGLSATVDNVGSSADRARSTPAFSLSQNSSISYSGAIERQPTFALSGFQVQRLRPENGPQSLTSTAAAYYPTTATHQYQINSFLALQPANMNNAATHEPLPSISNVLHQTRFNAASEPRPDTPRPSTSSLTASEWEEILNCTECNEGYISPDVATFFDTQKTVEGSQDLETTGREFIESPPIPVIGTVPRTFGDLLIPSRLLNPIPFGRVEVDQVHAPPSSLRDEPRASPPFKAVAAAAQQGSASRNPLSMRPRTQGKSARVRLFAGPEFDGQENQLANLEWRTTTASIFSANFATKSNISVTKPVSDVIATILPATKPSSYTSQPIAPVLKRENDIQSVTHVFNPVAYASEPIAFVSRPAQDDSKPSMTDSQPIALPEKSTHHTVTPPAPASKQIAYATRSAARAVQVDSAKAAAFAAKPTTVHSIKCEPTTSPPRSCHSLGSATPSHAPQLNAKRPRWMSRLKRCAIPLCTNGARSKGLCKRHGGGKRCAFEGCTRSDQGGGFCISHGGGKRCAAIQCKNSAQSRGFCKSHGGGKRCVAQGCGKSIVKGTFCREHGGAKLCKDPTCFNFSHNGGRCRSHNSGSSQSPSI